LQTKRNNSTFYFYSSFYTRQTKKDGGRKKPVRKIYDTAATAQFGIDNNPADKKRLIKNGKMNKEKRQQYKAGAVVKIVFDKNRLIFGRLFSGVPPMIGVYDFFINENTELPSIDQIVRKPILYYCGLYRSIITNGVFEIIGFKEFKEKEIASIPALFTQDMININDCGIFWADGGERKATPQECIGLERSSVWYAEGIVQRIEDHYAGKKNFYVEHQKVILSKDDPRYLPPPQALRWDFGKEEFYRTDK